MEEYTFKKKLGSINLFIILDSDNMEKLKKDVYEAAQRFGIEVKLRAEGFAFMRDNNVARLGLPHLRFGIIDNRAIVWVRSPNSFNFGLIRRAGFDPKKYYNELISLANLLKETFKRYKDKSSSIFLQVPKEI